MKDLQPLSEERSASRLAGTWPRPAAGPLSPWCTRPGWCRQSPCPPGHASLVSPGPHEAAGAFWYMALAWTHPPGPHTCFPVGYWSWPSPPRGPGPHEAPALCGAMASACGSPPHRQYRLPGWYSQVAMFALQSRASSTCGALRYMASACGSPPRQYRIPPGWCSQWPCPPCRPGLRGLPALSGTWPRPAAGLPGPHTRCPDWCQQLLSFF